MVHSILLASIAFSPFPSLDRGVNLHFLSLDEGLNLFFLPLDGGGLRRGCKFPLPIIPSHQGEGRFLSPEGY
jgi:hypothetical protein